jgi:hypothetical protein
MSTDADAKPPRANASITSVLIQNIEASPRFKGRVAGALYWLSVLIASIGELFVHGSLEIAAGLIAVFGMTASESILEASLPTAARCGHDGCP